MKFEVVSQQSNMVNKLDLNKDEKMLCNRNLPFLETSISTCCNFTWNVDIGSIIFSFHGVLSVIWYPITQLFTKEFFGNNNSDYISSASVKKKFNQFIEKFSLNDTVQKKRNKKCVSNKKTNTETASKVSPISRTHPWQFFNRNVWQI